MEVLPEFNLLDRRVHSIHTLIESLQVHTSMLGAFLLHLYHLLHAILSIVCWFNMAITCLVPVMREHEGRCFDIEQHEFVNTHLSEATCFEDLPRYAEHTSVLQSNSV